MFSRKKLDTSELAIGMYVSKLDRPWLETSFLLQGFLISSENDLKLMREECDFVYIDLAKDQRDRLKKKQEEEIERRSGVDRRIATGLYKIMSKFNYQTKTKVEEEIDVAKEIHKELDASIKECVESVRAGKIIDLRGIKVATTKMKECIIRNPNTFMLLKILKAKDSYSYSHCLDSSALCIAFGRHLGVSN
ncbi:MAG: DUF3391 domain-containing protein [Pseudomonadales bacterium]|nr:DUF3391 domain-containing protein [Pseudomonadales bacterium]